MSAQGGRDLVERLRLGIYGPEGVRRASGGVLALCAEAAEEIQQLQRAAPAPVAPPGYIEGVNVARLILALSRMGCATEGLEGTAAALADNINRLTQAVMRAAPAPVAPPSAMREAAQKALETLEALQGGCTDSGDGTVEAITVWCPEVIEELRATLAAPAPVAPAISNETVKAVIRASGFVTNSQAWDLADAVMGLITPAKAALPAVEQGAPVVRVASLPPLPPASAIGDAWPTVFGYDADDMRAYAAEAVQEVIAAPKAAPAPVAPRTDLSAKRHYDDTQFRVWPDGTVQCVEDGEPHSHMSDDYQVVAARDEAEALRRANGGGQ